MKQKQPPAVVGQFLFSSQPVRNWRWIQMLKFSLAAGKDLRCFIRLEQITWQEVVDWRRKFREAWWDTHRRPGPAWSPESFPEILNLSKRFWCFVGRPCASPAAGKSYLEMATHWEIIRAEDKKEKIAILWCSLTKTGMSHHFPFSTFSLILLFSIVASAESKTAL